MSEWDVGAEARALFDETRSCISKSEEVAANRRALREAYEAGRVSMAEEICTMLTLAAQAQGRRDSTGKEDTDWLARSLEEARKIVAAWPEWKKRAMRVTEEDTDDE